MIFFFLGSSVLLLKERQETRAERRGRHAVKMADELGAELVTCCVYGPPFFIHSTPQWPT